MKRFVSICLTLIAIMIVFAVKLRSQIVEPLKFVQSIPLPGLKDGDFEHFALDSAGQRLFLGAEDNLAVVVIDLRTNKLIHTISGLKTPPHSLAYRGDLKKLFDPWSSFAAETERSEQTPVSRNSVLPREELPRS